MNELSRDSTDHLVGAVAEDGLATGADLLDDPVAIADQQQVEGGVEDALAQDALAPVLLLLDIEQAGETAIKIGGTDQQDEQHKGRRCEAIDAAGIETQIEAAAIQHGAERDIEDPRAHDDHQPHVDHRVPRAHPERDQRDEAQHPGRGNDHDHGGAVGVALHDRRQQILSRRRQQGQHNHHSQGSSNAEQKVALRQVRWGGCGVAVVLRKGIGDHDERKAAVPEHVEPRRALRAGTQQSGGREEAGKRQRVGHHHRCREEITQPSRSSRRVRRIRNCASSKTAVIRSLIASAAS